mgnify:CR=1 FL=1
MLLKLLEILYQSKMDNVSKKLEYTYKKNRSNYEKY